MKTLRYLLTCCMILWGSTLMSQNFEVYVSDAGNYNNPPWQILKYSMTGDDPVSFIDEEIIWPQDILFLEDQDVVLISNLATDGYISKHDIHTGAYLGNFAENINGPTRMKIGADGLLYVLQWNNGDNKVLRYELDGTFVDAFTSEGVPQSIGIDWDADGNLYVSTYSGKYVEKFDTDGLDQGAFINSNLVGPTNIWFVENGDLLVNDYLDASVKRFSPDGEYLGIYIDGLFYPEGVTYLENGNLLIGNGGTSAVKMFDPDGNFIEDFIESGDGGLLTPNAIVIRNVDAVSVAENRDHDHFITPSVGTVFYLESNVSGKINSVEVYSLTGELVQAADTVSGQPVWSAGSNPDGIYIVVAETAAGDTFTQKVVVR